jgi:hypothetical protein
LLQVKPHINVSANREYPFRSACFAGHLKVAQWLLQVKPNIDIGDYDYGAILSAEYNKYINVVLRLMHQFEPHK